MERPFRRREPAHSERCHRSARERGCAQAPIRPMSDRSVPSAATIQPLLQRHARLWLRPVRVSSWLGPARPPSDASVLRAASTASALPLPFFSARYAASKASCAAKRSSVGFESSVFGVAPVECRASRLFFGTFTFANARFGSGGVNFDVIVRCRRSAAEDLLL